MSASSIDYEQLLREALVQARTSAPRASDDLVQSSSKAAEAVARVTEGAATLELVPLHHAGDAAPTYQLQLRKVGSESPPSDLGFIACPQPVTLSCGGPREGSGKRSRIN